MNRVAWLSLREENPEAGGKLLRKPIAACLYVAL
jgi:hypothetical protein